MKIGMGSVSSTHLLRDRVDDHFTQTGDRNDDEDNSGNKDRCQSRLPAVAELHADGVGEERVDAHARS